MVAFEEFASLLIVHAKPEEQSLYIYMKKEEDLSESRGFVRHEFSILTLTFLILFPENQLQ